MNAMNKIEVIQRVNSCIKGRNVGIPFLKSKQIFGIYHHNQMSEKLIKLINNKENKIKLKDYELSIPFRLRVILKHHECEHCKAFGIVWIINKDRYKKENPHLDLYAVNKNRNLTRLVSVRKNNISSASRDINDYYVLCENCLKLNKGEQ